MHRSFIVAMILAPALAGCVLSDDGHVQSVYPGGGSWATYEGDDGSALHVQVMGHASSVDPWLRHVDVMLLRIVYSSAQTNYTLLEAIDAEGRLVAQFTMCGSGEPSDDEDLFGCDSDRMGLLGGPHGLPGAFGAAPYWGGAPPEEGTHAQPAGLDSDVDAVDLRVSTDGSCVTLSRNESTASLNIRSLAFTFIGGPTKMCPGEPFPRLFTTNFLPFESPSLGSNEQVQYTRTGYHTEPGQPPSATPVGQAEVDLVTLEEPYYVHGLDPPVSFPPQEAHDAAMEQVPEYRAVMEDGGILLRFAHGLDRWSSIAPFGQELSDTDSYLATLVAVAPGGSAVEVQLREDETSVADQEQSAVTVDDSRTMQLPWPDDVQTEQTSFAFMRSQIGQIHNLSSPLEVMGFESNKQNELATKWLATADLGPRDEGVDLVISDFRQPVEFINFPFTSIFDGPSGAAIHLPAPYSSFESMVRGVSIEELAEPPRADRT